MKERESTGTQCAFWRNKSCFEEAGNWVQCSSVQSVFMFPNLSLVFSFLRKFPALIHSSHLDSLVKLSLIWKCWLAKNKIQSSLFSAPPICSVFSVHVLPSLSSRPPTTYHLDTKDTPVFLTLFTYCMECKILPAPISASLVFFNTYLISFQVEVISFLNSQSILILQNFSHPVKYDSNIQ